MNRLALFFAALLLSCILLSPEFSLAQPPPPPIPSPAVPIDGGLGILMAAGITLGGKKLWDKKHKI